jgi:hypothetical protein
LNRKEHLLLVDLQQIRRVAAENLNRASRLAFVRVQMLLGSFQEIGSFAMD